MNLPFSTEVKIEKSNFIVDYNTPMLFVGSCFSDNIGGILQRVKFPVMLNPFGVLYNPVSIARSVDFIVRKVMMEEDSLIFQNNLWHSFNFHGSFSGVDKQEVLQRCNDSIVRSHDFLKNAQYLFVTFGTAWVYELARDNQIVSNCHKLPSKEFNRYRLSVDAIVSDWSNLISQLQKFNPELKIIFTVSPVRHFKDGAHENQLSKSTLMLAIDDLIKLYTEALVAYFPAYEIVNDELRDYRFYASDMVHVSDLGVQFIFERFKESFLSLSTIKCTKDVEGIVVAKEHRFLTDDKMSIKKFGASMLSKIEKLSNNYPYINFKPEYEYFKNLGQNE